MADLQQTESVKLEAVVEAPKSPAVLPHTRLGIASFSLSLLAIFIFLLLFIFINTPGFSETAKNVVFYISLFTSLTALGLGIAGYFQKEVRKLYAILGICFSIGFIVIIIALFILAYLKFNDKS